MSNNIKRLIEQAIQSQLPGAVVRKIHPLNEGKKPKPDYIDIDKDGNKKEPMKKAIKDKDHCDSAVDESKKKPSSGLSKKEKSSVVKKAKAGKDIGKKGKGFDALAKKAGGGEKGKKIAAAAMWKNVAREDVNEAENEKCTVKYKMKKTDKKMSVAEYDNRADAEKFLDSIKKKGGNGIISKTVNEDEVTEKAKSKAQQKFFGVVNSMQKGDQPKKGKAGEAAKSMSKKDVKDFASTKHKGLPKKVKKTDENASGGSSGSGAVATTNLPILGDKKITEKQVGNGIYESLLRGYRNDMLPTAKKQLNESISITVDDEDAEALLQLLAMAGIQQQPSAVVVSDEEPLGENKPNWPTKPETFQDTPTLSSYSGGLNKPKTTGQSTVPVLASQKDRQIAYEDVELERSLFKLYQDYKGE
jgi:hypothetical protein